MNTNDIKTGYAKLMKAVAEDDFYKIDLTNRVNCYVCQSCSHITKTKDIDAGVTPFIIRCEKCGKEAQSTMYRDIAPHLNPTFEWYRPSLEETISRKDNPDFDLEHVLMGGLERRKIKAGMSFGDAITAMKDGHLVRRAGWNGKGMHIYLEEHFSFPVGAGAFKGHVRKYDACICMFTAQGTHQPGWLASQPDILANDWELVEPFTNK
jgi:hypothetical protein